MKKNRTVLIWMLPLLFAGWLIFSNYQVPSETQQETTNADVIEWMSLEEALQASKKERKKIYIDLYTSWCSWCKVMDKKTFANQEVIDYMRAHYYPVKFNAEQKEDVVFRGKTFAYLPNEGRRGVHGLAKELTRGELAYPTSVILDENLNVIVVQPGYIEANKFKHILVFLDQEIYKKMSWSDYYSKNNSN